MACANLRKNNELFKIVFGDDSIIFRKAEPVDFNRLVRIPTYKWLYERYYSVLNDIPANKPGRKNDVLIRLSKELVEVYLYCDLCPKTEATIKKNIEKRIKILEKIRHELKTTRESSKIFFQSTVDFLQDLNWGVNILNLNRQEYLGITLGDDEIDLFKDNCDPYIDSNGKKVVRYIAKVEGKLHPSAKKAKKRLEKLHSLDLYYSKIRQDDSERKCSTDSISNSDEEEVEEKIEVTDEEWGESSVKKRRLSVDEKGHKMSLPKTLRSKNSTTQETASDIHPQYPVRLSFKTFNPDVIAQIARLEAVWRIPARVSREVLVDIANNLFHQQWVILQEKSKTETSDNIIGDAEEEEVVEDESANVDWKYVMPSRKTMRKYIEDAAILNFQYAAETMIATKESGGVLTLGTDDTVKLAGRTSFDFKTGVVTAVNKTEEGKKERTTLSLGYQENLSHKGVDSAQTVKTFLGQVGACVDLSDQEVLEMFDFFMDDRARDNNTMLDELDVSEEKKLNCNAHILLCVTSTADKVFRDVETSAGLQKLIGNGANSAWNSSHSVWYLGLNAFSTLISPIKSQESVNVYKDYKKFLNDVYSDAANPLNEKAKNVLSEPFLGFDSNRFGRLAYLSTLFLSHFPLLTKFFDQVVDENQNKLQLACSCYLTSKWFELSCQVVNELNTLVVQPLRLALGIDDCKKQRSEHRSWFGLKELLPDILSNLERNTSNITGIDGLKKKVFFEVKVAVNRQMSTMKFYTATETMSKEVLNKIESAPMTNSASESNLGDVTYDITRSAGSDTKMQTFSNKNVIRKNKVFDSCKWKEMSDEERVAKWKWARNSPQAKKVREIGRKYFESLNIMKAASLAAKEKKKVDKKVKAMGLLEKCKKWGGPVTEQSIESIKNLDADQLLIEVRYLRATIAPNIREKRKEGNTFIKFDKTQLMDQIRNAIKPVADDSQNVENILASVFGVNKENEAEEPGEEFTGESSMPEVCLGVVGQFQGPLNEMRIGVVVAVGSKSMLKLYESRRHGYLPASSAPQPLDEWKLVEEIEDYYYATYPTNPDIVLLKF